MVHFFNVAETYFFQNRIRKSSYMVESIWLSFKDNLDNEMADSSNINLSFVIIFLLRTL